MTAEPDQNRLTAGYWFLMRAYPADFRRARGVEMVSMLLEGARPGQRRPTAVEAADLLCGGLRRRLGLWRLVAPSSLRIAGAVAYALAAGLSLFWLTGPELSGESRLVQSLGSSQERMAEPFQTSAPVMYLAWLAGAAAVVLFGRYGRRLAVLALVLTWGMVYLAEPFNWPDPNSELRSALLRIGLLALAVPAHPTRRQRLALGCGVLGVAAMARFGSWLHGHLQGTQVSFAEAFVGAGVAAVVALLVAIGIGLDRKVHLSWRGHVGSLTLLLLAMFWPLMWATYLFG